MSIPKDPGVTRRDFLYVAATSATAVGTALALWPVIDQMNPAADVLALSTVDVDLAPIPPGQQITVLWQLRPVFVRHRTQAEIVSAEDTLLSNLIDPATDASRVKKPEWLIVVGVCTHLGCVPIAHRGPYDGYLCPCHGSVYDTSGRVRRGPAPTNLPVPPYTFVSDTKIKIG